MWRYLFDIDWQELFVPKLTAAEILIRGLVVYVTLCLLLRVVLRRQAGKIALSDLLVVTLVAGVCRNPLIANAYSIPDALAVVTVILGCSYAVDWLSYYSPTFHRLFHPPPVLLVQDGEIIHSGLRHELMTEQQLRAKLRRYGIGDIAEVAQAWMEGDGHVTAIRKK
jgi:uncharacterized membrane protein YcaP (DUF421 family)